MKSTKPSQSGPLACGARDSATCSAAMTTAATPNGTFTKKIQRQDRPVVSTPPASGPIATARPVTRAPDAERDAAFLAAERVGEQRQRHREHDRAADALQAPGQLQHQRGLVAKPHSARRGREDDQADEVHQPAAVHVREAARGQQERRQGQRVGVDDPLQVGEARVQRALDVRQRDVHDRDVEQQHERAEADRDERPPLVAALRVLVLGLMAAVVGVLALDAFVLAVMAVVAGLVSGRGLTDAPDAPDAPVAPDKSSWASVTMAPGCAAAD